MSAEILNLGLKTQLLNGLNKHDQSPGGILMKGSPVERGIVQLEGVDRFSFQDGTAAFTLDPVGLGLLRELPLGSVLGFMDFGTSVQPNQLGNQLPAYGNHFIHSELLALVLGQNPSYTQVAFLRNGKQNSDGKFVSARWGLDQKQPFGLSQKDEAMLALQRLFDPSNGIEGSQMQTVFDLGLQLPGDKRVQEFGCFSHNDPKKATAMNILKGGAQLGFVSIADINPNQWVRIALNNGYPEGLPVPAVSDLEGFLMFQGMLAAAGRVATMNPSGMGAGTNRLGVFEAMVESAIGLPEQVMNGATVGQIQAGFRSQLGLRS